MCFLFLLYVYKGAAAAGGKKEAGPKTFVSLLSSLVGETVDVSAFLSLFHSDAFSSSDEALKQQEVARSLSWNGEASWASVG